MTDILGETSEALLSTLSAGTVLTALLSTAPNTGTAVSPAIYDTQAPDEASPPYIVFNHQGGGPDNITSSDIESNLWLVKAYSATLLSNASSIFNEADKLLHKQNISINGGTVNTWWCCREENVKLVENPPSGKPIFMRGGVYRIRTSG